MAFSETELPEANRFGPFPLTPFQPLWTQERLSFRATSPVSDVPSLDTFKSFASDSVILKWNTMGQAREIYLKACCEIADALQTHGFRWRKSRHDTVKKDNDLTFRIWFQSSFRNAQAKETADTEKGTSELLTAELFVPLEIELAEIERFGSISFMTHVSVHSEKIKKWRANLAYPIRSDDGVAGTNIGNLAPRPHRLEVNLANPKAPISRIHAIIELIRHSGFRYFDRFRHPDEVVASLLTSSDPGMVDYMELEYAVCYGSLPAASQVLERYLQKWPDCAVEYQEALREYRQNGIPAELHGRPGPRLARMALALGIEE